jgi:tetraacyldisaccharide 4'-kinase
VGWDEPEGSITTMKDVWVRMVWERRGIGGKLLWWLFLPLAFFYRSGVQFRNALFRWGWLKSTQLPRPVISVGNLTVGGTGKTPTCLWLARELRQRGFKVGILSRGYRRHEKRPTVLAPKGEELALVQEQDVLQSGDEPLMMARLYGQNVGVSKNRRRAAVELLNVAEVDVFVLDDGFQHRWVKRDVDLLLLGAETSGSVLPTGPFREPQKNLQRADFLLATGAHEIWAKIVPERRRASLYTATLRPLALVGLSAGSLKEFPLTLLYRSKVLTVTGVADPRGLYRLIHEWEGEIVNTLEFEDHHFYGTSDWQEINRLARSVDLIITTEKDILKLQRFPFAKDKLLALRVAMAVDDGSGLVAAIVDKIQPGGGA